MGCYYVLCVEVRTRSVLNQGCRLPSFTTYADVILLQLPPNPQGVRSPQPVHAVHSPYCRVLVRVPLWECVHGDGKCRTWSNYHSNRVQYPHCCSITMVIRMQYSLVLRTYVRTAQCRARKKIIPRVVHTYVSEYQNTSMPTEGFSSLRRPTLPVCIP